jgi:hypothetical protein
MTRPPMASNHRAHLYLQADPTAFFTEDLS